MMIYITIQFRGFRKKIKVSIIRNGFQVPHESLAEKMIMLLCSSGVLFWMP